MSSRSNSLDGATAPVIPAFSRYSATLDYADISLPPIYNQLLVHAIYSHCPDLLMPDSLKHEFGGKPFPHEKYLLWRLVADTLEDVVIIEKFSINWDPIAPPEMMVDYHLNPAYCIEHRIYMTSEDGVGSHFRKHGMSGDEYTEYLAKNK